MSSPNDKEKSPETGAKAHPIDNAGKLPSGRIFLAILAVFLVLALPNALEAHGLWPDEALYLGATKNFLSGKGLVLGAEKGIFPGLPLLSSALIFLSGGEFSKTPFYIGTLIAALSSIVLTYFLARRLSNNELVPLGASALLAFNHVFFFYSSRALLDIYDSAICAGGLLFASYYLENPNPKRAGLFGLLAASGYLIRLPNLSSLAVIFLASHFSSKRARKDFLSLGAFLVSAAVPVGIWLAVSGTGILGVYSGASGNYIQMALSNLGNFWGSAGFIQLNIFVFLLSLGGLFLFRKSELFFPLLIFSIFSPVSRLAGIPYDARYFMSILPGLSISAANLAMFPLEKFLKSKELRAAIFGFAIIGLSLYSYSIGEGMHNSKKGGYVEIEYSGEWLAKNAEGERIFAGAYRIVSLFHNGQVSAFPETEKALLEQLERGEVEYLEVNNYDWAQPQYALGLPSKYPDLFVIEKQFVNSQGAGSIVLRYTGGAK